MRKQTDHGFTIPEMIITIIIFVIISSSVFTLLLGYISSTTVVQLRATALGVATEQMEYLRSLSYDDLAIQGGTILTSGTPIPPSKEVKRSNRTFVVKTNIIYADDAYDGCLTYPAGQSYLCRNGPPALGKPVDSDPRDYKLGEVIVLDKTTGNQFAFLSSQFTSRVAETAGNSSAITVKAIDSSGAPVENATINVVNTTTTPAINQTTTTDDNGIALFLDIVPDSGKDYQVTASKSGYSTLSTIPASGSLVPNYPNVNAIVQKVSNVTLQIDPISDTSLKATVVDTSGAAVPNASFTLKGGIKLYTSLTDQTYSYNQTISTDGSGSVTLGSLTPGNYQVCYGTNNVCAGSRYLSVVQAAYGSVSTQPFTITAGTTSPSGSGPMQLIKLFTSTSTAFPRIFTIVPGTVSASAGGANASGVTITGANISGAVVQLRQGATVINSTSSTSNTPGSIGRQFNLAGVSTGPYEVILTVSGNQAIQTGIPPGTLGGINVIP